MKAILVKILGHKQFQFSLESLHYQFREKFTKQKYLIILDDVWIEDRLEWQKLEVFLEGGAPGSWVLVTTRSRATAKIIGSGSMYDLKGLSDENSWRLFEMVAFGRVGRQANLPDLGEIGQKVVKKCANVPLAIRVAGCLLYGQPRVKWESFGRSGFAEFDSEKYGILPTLKFSYNHLESPLKCCFSYCALFPKDYEIEKEMVIRLWEAQGYIVPSGDERKEDVAEEYFSILLHRCFFKDVRRYRNGGIKSFKIHDLFHYVAQQVARKEIAIVDHFTGELDNRILHLNVCQSMNIKGNSSRKTIRTLFSERARFEVGAPLEKWMSLRALVMRNSPLKEIPDAIGELLHLRLVDFSYSSHLERLPKSFTELRNLETLMLLSCRRLRELPDDIDKLVKLRCLFIGGCSELDIPKSIGKLTSLENLPYFVVKRSNSLEGLSTLEQLKGSICLKLNIVDGDEVATNVKEEIGEGAVLINKQHLNHICLKFPMNLPLQASDYQKALLKMLQPHENLKNFEIWRYNGDRLPSWTSGHKLGSSLSNLVIMKLYNCDILKYLSGLGKLRHLRTLELDNLQSLEYMEESRNRNQLEEEHLFFPSLKRLKLIRLPKLKGWWREEEEEKEDDPPSQPSFPHLTKLTIEECKELTSIPAIPNVEHVNVRKVNKRLRINVGGVNEKEERTLQSNEDEGFTYSARHRMNTDNVGLVASLLSTKALQCLTELAIVSDEMVETLKDEEEMWQSCSSSLRILHINSCNKLKSVYNGGLDHLSALEELTISDCKNVTLSDELSSSLCPPFSHTIRSLTLVGLPLVNLPEWMQHLNSLRSLHITSCKSLKSLPEWMPRLTSLTSLKITECSEELQERCSRNPPGEYWPYICHIRNVTV